MIVNFIFGFLNFGIATKCEVITYLKCECRVIGHRHYSPVNFFGFNIWEK